MSAEPAGNRPLTAVEYRLICWMLEHGEAGATRFLSQLDLASVTSWKCECGCASFKLAIDGQAEPTGGMHVLADFVFGSDADLSGIFVWEQSGVLAGLEVYGLAGDAPKSLPEPESLRRMTDAGS